MNVVFDWSAFLIFAAVTVSTPGPNTIACMSNGSRKGFIKGLPFNFGIFTGFVIVMLVCAVFTKSLNDFLPKIKFPLLVVGAGYMLFLAWKIFRRGDKVGDSDKDGTFLSGFLLQFVNPKIYFYGIVANQNYILPSYSEKPVILAAFAVILALIALFFGLCWSAFGGILKTLFSKYAKVLNTIMALLLVYCAVRFFV